MSDPYFDSANQQIDQSKKALLDAVATNGQAGKQAFDAAQAQAAQARQDALTRAAQSRALYGGVGGSDQTILGAYDARMNQAAVNRSNFESGLAQTQASGDSYLEKARGAIPVLQAVNTNKLTDQETKIKLAIQAAKDKADAAAAKEAATQQAAIDRENRADQRSIERENRADARAAAKEAAKAPKLPKASDILNTTENLASFYGEGTTPQTEGRNWVTDQMQMAAQDRAAFNHTDPNFELSKLVAEAYGVTPDQAMKLVTPSNVAKSTTTATKNIAALNPNEKNAYADTLAKKYASKGVTPSLAKSVVNNVDFQDAVNWLSNGADGKTRDEVEKILRANFLTKDNRNWLAEYNVLTGEYLPRIPTA